MVRTRNESLQHILNELEAGRLGAVDADDASRCVYEDNNGNHCAIGCLLTPAHHLKISYNNAEGYSLGSLVNPDSMLLSLNEIAPGFTIEELAELQNLHDAWARPAGWDDNTTPKATQLAKFRQKVDSMLI